MRELIEYGGAIITSHRDCAEPEIFDSFPSVGGWRGIVFEVLKRAIAGAAEDFDTRRARLGEVERRKHRVLSIALQEQVSKLVGINSEFNARLGEVERRKHRVLSIDLLEKVSKFIEANSL